MMGRKLSHASIVLIALIALISCVAPTMAEDTTTDNVPLLKADGLEMDYIYSFNFDNCGEYKLGKRIREALFAKLESCPFTPEAKQKFYKDAASITNKALAGYLDFLFNHSLTNFVPPKDVHCEGSDHETDARILQEKLSDYDAGKIDLANVIVNGTGPRIGEPITCLELSRGMGTPSGNGMSTGEKSSDNKKPQ